jgi:hypothetical protein
LTNCSSISQTRLPRCRDLESTIGLFHTESIPESRVSIKVVDQDDIKAYEM